MSTEFNKDIAHYTMKIERGGRVRMGYPLAPYLKGIIGYKLDDTRLSLEPEGDPDLFPVETANGLTQCLDTISYLRQEK